MVNDRPITSSLSDFSWPCFFLAIGGLDCFEEQLGLWTAVVGECYPEGSK